MQASAPPRAMSSSSAAAAAASAMVMTPDTADTAPPHTADSVPPPPPQTTWRRALSACHPRQWRYSAIGLSLLCAVFLLPLLVVYSSWLQFDQGLWQHLTDTVLSDYLHNSLLLALGVGIGALGIGTSLAWCVVHYQFVGRSWLQWLLLLPMAMPAYIIAYTYTGLLDVAGPLQSALRASFDWRYGDYYFPEIRSLPGAIVLLSLVLYPYVYLLARTAFASQSSRLLEASLSLGLNRRQHFCRVTLPMARPALATGMALAMMEAFADYGTVQYFGVPTLTTGIFRTWFGMGHPSGAAQLAALLCSLVLVVMLFELKSRRQLHFYYSGQSTQRAEATQLGAGKGLIALILCSLPLLLGFVIPALQLLSWAWPHAAQLRDPEFLTLLWHSFSVASVAAVLVVLFALLLAYGLRLFSHGPLQWLIRLSAMGYAVPGTVIAIGVMWPLAALDNQLDLWVEQLFGIRIGLLFSGTLFALLLAYSVRFLAVALQGIEAGLGQIKPSMDQAARSLGLSQQQVLWRIHVPLLRASVFTAALLVFVDVLKELPATLLLRPFNFNTLAVRTFELAADERLADAALPALTIVLIGLVPVFLLARALDKSTAGVAGC
jgi:iron(III) transport system permease protein